MVALTYSNNGVATDCQGAIASLRAPKAWSHALVQLAPSNQATRITHVYAHPELVKAAKDYTSADRGIFLADAVAGGQIHLGDGFLDDRQSLVVSDIEILRDLSAALRQPFISTLAGVINLEPLLHRHQRQIHQKYLIQRDRYQLNQDSAVMGSGVTWEGTSFSIYHQLFERTTGARRTQCQRIGLDWHSTGRQNFKYSGKIEDLKCIPCEGPLENQQHTWHPSWLSAYWHATAQTRALDGTWANCHSAASTTEADTLRLCVYHTTSTAHCTKQLLLTLWTRPSNPTTATQQAPTALGWRSQTTYREVETLCCPRSGRLFATSDHN